MKLLQTFARIIFVFMVTLFFSCSHGTGDVKKDGGIELVLEASVSDVLTLLADDKVDSAFNVSLSDAYELQKTSTSDYVTLFGETFHKKFPDKKLAPYFVSIETREKININSTNEEVIKFLQGEAETAMNATVAMISKRLDYFGVEQPTVKRVGNSSRISLELPGVMDQKRINKLVQSSANLEFWETYDNSEMYQYFDAANKKLSEAWNSVSLTDNSSTKKDTSNSLSGQLERQKDSTTQSLDEMKLKNPLFALLRPAVSVGNEGNYSLSPGPVVGTAVLKDTSTINGYFRMEIVKSALPKYCKFLWTTNAFGQAKDNLQLVAIKTDRSGKAPLAGNCITDARKVFEQASGGLPQISMTMNNEAALEWKRLTKENIGKSIALVLDNYVYSYPTVQGEISGGNSSITGNFTNAEADDLVSVLKAGKLPVRLQVVQEVIIPPLEKH